MNLTHFKDFVPDMGSTHAKQRRKERVDDQFTDRVIQLFENRILEDTLITKFLNSLEGKVPDHIGYEFFIHRKVPNYLSIDPNSPWINNSQIPYTTFAAIGIFKQSFKKNEGLMVLIKTYLPVNRQLNSYYYNDVVWCVEVISDTEVKITPEVVGSNPQTFSSPHFKPKIPNKKIITTRRW